jgi:hypothetical protein
MYRAAALTLFLLALPAWAEAPETPAPGGGGVTPPGVGVQDPAGKPAAAFGEDHADCAEWTDRCIVCKREADGPACSLSGIACVPTTPACLDKR